MYAIKNEDEDKLFQDRSRLLKRNMSPEDAMKYLGINQKFILSVGEHHTSVKYESESHLKSSPNL